MFNLVSRANERRHIKWHETCKCKCRLDVSTCNNKHRWNDDKCWCECKELIDKRCMQYRIYWNPSNCKCECNKSCDVEEYLDYENFKCRKRLVDKLVEECAENIDEVKNENELKNKRCSYMLYIVLFSVLFTINIAIATYLVHSKYMNRNEEIISG